MNYNTLRNKPTINHKELIGNNKASDIGGMNKEDMEQLLTTDLTPYYTKDQIDDLFSRSFVYREKTGSIVTFDCPSTSQTIPEVTTEIVAVQSGSGDPSPTNVRPISGFTEANVTKAGKNLCKSIIHGYVSNSENKVVIDNDSESAIFYAKKGTTYTISSSANMDKSRLGLVATENVVNNTPCSEVVDLETNIKTWTATWDGWTVWYVCENRKTAFDTSAQVEIGTTPTTYEPYNGQTYNIQFKDGDNPLTVYGGSYDVINGTSGNRNTLGFVDLGSLNWLYSDSRKAFNVEIPEISMEVYSVMASCYTYYGTITSASQMVNIPTGKIVRQNGNKQIFLKDDRYTDVTALKEAISGQIMLYTLATPTTFDSTPTVVKSLLGTNNLWADSGDITVKALDKIIQE